MNAAERKKKALNCDIIAQDKKRRRDIKITKNEDNCAKKARKNAPEKSSEKTTTKLELEKFTPHARDNPDNDTPPPIRRDSVPVLSCPSFD